MFPGRQQPFLQDVEVVMDLITGDYGWFAVIVALGAFCILVDVVRRIRQK